MYVLGSWAVSNIAGGLILRANTQGTERYFHEMNAGWNSVNLVLASIGILGKQNSFENTQSLSDAMVKAEKTFLFNAALDIAYMTAGFWMMDAANYRVNDSERLEGYGQSLLLQGGFLFVFDLIMHHQVLEQRKKLNKKNNLQLHSTGTGISLVFKLD